MRHQVSHYRHQFGTRANEGHGGADLCAHPCLPILDIVLEDLTIRVVNYYNDVADKSALQTLLQLDLDTLVSTILLGDFNTHSPSWSPPGMQRSSHAPKWKNGWPHNCSHSFINRVSLPAKVPPRSDGLARLT